MTRLHLEKFLLFLFFVSGAFAQGTNPAGVILTPSTSASGSMTAVDGSGLCALNNGTSNQCVTIHLPINANALAVQLSGTFSATETFRMSVNNQISWVTQSTSSAVGITTFTLSGQTDFQVQTTAFTSGTVVVSISVSINTGQTQLISATGINNLVLNNPAGGIANDLTIGVENQEIMVCSLSMAYRFQTIAAGLAAIKNSGISGGIIRTCPGHSETSTVQTDIGCQGEAVCGGTNWTATVILYTNTTWTCNDAAGGTDACWNIHNGSALFGMTNGVQGASRTGGAYLKYACTAKTAYGVNTPEGQAGTGQSYAMMKNVAFEGCSTGTVAGGGSPSISAVNVEAISVVNEWANFIVFNFANTIQIRVASNNNGSNTQVGPIVFTNVWSDCGYDTGCQPWQFIANTKGLLSMYVTGGVCNHPGAGITCLEINGNGTQGLGGHISMYFENLQNGNSIMAKIRDTSNLVLDAIPFVDNLATDTFVDISESAVNLTCNLHISQLRGQNTSATMINNHISGQAISAESFQPFYTFGGDAGCNIGATVHDELQLSVLNKTGVAGLFKNNADSEMDHDIDTGKTATQNAYYRADDRGTAIWGFGHNASNTGAILDIANNHFHFAAVRSGETDLNSFGASGVQFNSNGASTGPVASFTAFMAKGTAVTLSGTGACATFGTNNSSSFAGSSSCSGTTGASTLTITFAFAAIHGYECDVQDETTRANLFQQTSHSTTTCVLTATSITSGDVFVFKAIGF